MDNQISALILASGLSERMKQHKALLRWNDSTTFIEKIFGEFAAAGCERIICMINSLISPSCASFAVPNNVKFIVNPHPEYGRFFSVRTGLNEMKDSEYCFIHNVDNPFVNADVIEKLLAKRSSGSWCSPVFKGKGGHPVLVSNAIIRRIIKTEDLNTNLNQILDQYPKTILNVDNDLVLRNINTPDDYAKYFCH